MNWLLAIETSSAQGSLALLRDGVCVATAELTLPRRHNEELLPQVHALLAQAGAELSALVAVAYGRGPGSFTGVRLAAAAAQALGWGLEVPVFAIGSAETLALQAWRDVADTEATSAGGTPDAIVALDARVGQLYWLRVRADGAGRPVAEAPHLLAWTSVPDTPAAAGALGRFVAVGDAWSDARMPAALSAAAHALRAELLPHARTVGELAWARWQAGERPAAAAEQPAYIRGADAWC